MTKFILLAGGLVVIAILIFLIFSVQGNSSMENMFGMTAPNFALTDFEGRTVKSEDFKGRPMVINSWAAWCPFCVKELEDFAAAQKEFGDKVAIIAVDRAESLETAKKFTDKLGVTTDDLVLLLDPSDSFYRSIGGFAMPETIFVNSEHKIVHHKRGPMDLDEIRAKINDILK